MLRALVLLFSSTRGVFASDHLVETGLRGTFGTVEVETHGSRAQDLAAQEREIRLLLEQANDWKALWPTQYANQLLLQALKNRFRYNFSNVQK